MDNRTTDERELNVVFHLLDEALFKRFLDGLTRDDLLKPFRASKDLVLRYFRGYRLSDTSPTSSALFAAFQKEIRERHNGQLVSHLCYRWLVSHAELWRAGLRSLGVEAELAEVKMWLPRVQNALADERGHYASGVQRMVRALAFDYEPDDVAILVSIFSEIWSDQERLQATVYQSLHEVAQDPEAQKRHCEEQLLSLESVRASLKQALTELTVSRQAHTQSLSAEVESTKGDLETTRQQMAAAESEVARLDAEYVELAERLQKAKQLTLGLEATSGRLTARLKELDESIKKSEESADAEAQKLSRRQQEVDSEETRLRQALQGAEAAIQQRQTQVVLAESTTTVDTLGFPTSPTQAVSPGRWLNEVLEDVYAPTFTSSSITLELLRMKRAGLVSGHSGEEPPTPESVTSQELQQSLASYIVFSDNRWSRSALAQYALAKCGSTTESDEALTDTLVSGLYHAGRVADASLTYRLLAALMSVVVGARAAVTPAANPEVLLDGAAMAIESPEFAASLGTVQTKIATANPRALLVLYDTLPQKPRIALKRALVARLPTFGLDEHDPTHELLDVVNTRIAAIVAPLSSLVRATWKKGALSSVASMRDQSLRATKGMLGVFSADTDRRLQHFRQLLGTDVTAAVREHSPDGYGRLLRQAREFVEAELLNPEWISARYLVPIALEIARCAVSADLAVRETLQASLIVEPDKIQQPIGTGPRRIEVGLTITNRGTAAATDVELVMMAGGGKPVANVVNPEIRFASVPIHAPVRATLTIDISQALSALELDFLVSWRDPSPDRKELTGSVKLTAQRAVDWERAKINPYSLRSITTPEKLFGREGALERLRSGVLGMQSFYLTGQKRVGKSSVARVLQREFAEKGEFVSVYITLGELQAESPQVLMTSLLRNVAARAVEALRERLLEALNRSDAHLQTSSTVFINTLEQFAPDVRVLCVIDDFDELAEGMYKGPEAHTLFLQLRALIDRGCMAFVFVGSERLPEILRFQGERLNQVSRHNLDYLSERDDLAGLVRQPAKDVLEYEEGAVNKITDYSAGNPYYATQICHRVYQDLIARRDHYASVADIERSVTEIADEESVSTFQHFWKDGIFAAPNEAERFQHLNALMLLSISRDAQGGEWKSREIFETDQDLRRYSPGEIRYRLDELVERRVLERREDRVRVRVPLFAKWLAGNGAVSVRASFGERQWETLMAGPRKAVSPAELVSLASNWVYQGSQVNEIRLKAWLEQFGDERNQELAFQIVRYIRSETFYDEARLFPLFKKCHSLVIASQTSERQWAQQVRRGRARNVYVSYVAKEGKSGSAISYTYRTANALSQQMVGKLEDAAQFLKGTDTPSALILVDDFIGTGETIVEGLRELDKLMDGSLQDRGHTAYVVAALGLAQGVSRVNSETGVHCIVGEELGTQSRAFSPDSGVFASEVDRRAAEALCRTIGEALEPKQPLGYGDCQSLVVFAHRCPNNSLPILYKGGRKYQGKEWIPLFPRG